MELFDSPNFREGWTASSETLASLHQHPLFSVDPMKMTDSQFAKFGVGLFDVTDAAQSQINVVHGQTTRSCETNKGEAPHCGVGETLRNFWTLPSDIRVTPTKRATVPSDITPLINMVLSALETPSRLEVATHVKLEFKQHRQKRFRLPRGGPVPVEGQYVIVQRSDGLVDCGLCVGTDCEPEEVSAGTNGRIVVSGRAASATLIGAIGGAKANACAGIVVRPANDTDYQLIENGLPAMENKAIGLCHQLVHFLHLPFEVVDAEFTFDMKEVVISYRVLTTSSSTSAPNLPRLQRELSHSLKSTVVLHPITSP